LTLGATTNSPRAELFFLELHTSQAASAIEFYSGLLAWSPELVRVGRGSYLALDIGQRIGGGVIQDDAEPPMWMPYVAVPDLGAAIERAAALGGSEVLDRRVAPTGKRTVVAAPDGSELGLWEPGPNR
jgi:predicted enzyme related to lactoylglutathione lyase